MKKLILLLLFIPLVFSCDISSLFAPSLNMEISTGSINLGLLEAGIESTGTLDLEIGTNAVNGATITARSQSGGLTNTVANLTAIEGDTAAMKDQIGKLNNNLDNLVKDTDLSKFIL